MTALLEYYNITGSVLMQSHQSDQLFVSLRQSLMSTNISVLSSNLVLLVCSSMFGKFL